MKWELTPEYLEDLLVRMAHHSTAIEGNSLTLGDTRTIIISNRIPHAMDMREFYEVRNYKDLQIFLEKKVDSPIEISDIQEINKILLRDIDSRGGRFKVIPNIVLGADFIPTPPYKVLEELKKWVDDLQWRMENTHSEKEKTLAIMDQHLRFEHIHPFADGNGRTGRALMIWSCLGNHIVPIVIEKEQRDDYIRALNDKNIPALLKMAEEIQAKEKERPLQIKKSWKPWQRKFRISIKNTGRIKSWKKALIPLWTRLTAAEIKEHYSYSVIAKRTIKIKASCMTKE